MPVDAALIIGAWVDKVIGQAGDDREFTSAFWIIESVSGAAVDGTVADADVGETA